MRQRRPVGGGFQLLGASSGCRRRPSEWGRGLNVGSVGDLNFGGATRSVCGTLLDGYGRVKPKLIWY